MRIRATCTLRGPRSLIEVIRPALEAKGYCIVVLESESERWITSPLWEEVERRIVG